MDQLLEQPLAHSPLVVIDTETTGLSPALGHRVVEVAAVRLEGWKITGVVNSLVNPGRPMDPGATRVNGIYDEDLVDEPPFAAVAADLAQLIDGALLVAHNAHFDAAFLGMEYDLLNPISPMIAPRPAIANPWLCTLQLARRLFYFDRNSLSQVARNLGVPMGRSHRALNDVHTTIGILKRMTKELARLRLVSVADYLHAQGGAIFAPPQFRSPLPPAVAEALARRCSLQIKYEARGATTERVISPLYATEQDGFSYVVAFCHLRQAQRTFKIERILAARLLD